MATREQALAALAPLNLSFFVGAGDSPLSWTVKVEAERVDAVRVVVNRQLNPGYASTLRLRVNQALNAAKLKQTPEGLWI